MRHLVVFATVLVLLAGCVRSEVVTLPSNVSLTSDSYGQHYISQIDFSYVSRQPVDFAKAKLCVAQSLANNDVTISDAVGTHVGAFTGTYYQKNNAQTMAGKDVFKYVDDSAATLIANGTTTSTPAPLITNIIKYEMKLAVRGNNVTMQLMNINRAQKETGFAANAGFAPLGAWAGAGAQSAYAALETEANKVKGCMGQ